MLALDKARPMLFWPRANNSKPGETMNIKDSVAVITGAAGGIGRAVGLELAKRGACGIGLVDQSEFIEEVADAINEFTGTKVAVGYSGDVSDADFRSGVFADLKVKYGTVNICIPAAGITRDRLAVKFDKETGTVSVYPIETFRQIGRASCRERG